MANFFDELKRRSVFRVGISYVVMAWLVLQLTDLVFENMNAPDWVMQAIMLVIAVGFPIALTLAWAFEIKADGVHSDAPGSAKNSRIFYTFVGIFSIAAVGLFLWQQSGTSRSDYQLIC
jgi:hypothetical protein